MPQETQPTILFLCTGNSCRSQMAEGWARHFHGERYNIYSAGIEAHGLNPHAVEVMREAGVDISSQASQTLAELSDVTPDLVITVCGHADANCPVLSVRTRKLHQPFDDPPALAKGARDPQEALSHYRRVRDEIRTFTENLPQIVEELQ